MSNLQHQTWLRGTDDWLWTPSHVEMFSTSTHGQAWTWRYVKSSLLVSSATVAVMSLFYLQYATSSPGVPFVSTKNGDHHLATTWAGPSHWPSQRSRFLVLTKRSAASGDENEPRFAVSQTWDTCLVPRPQYITPRSFVSGHVVRAVRPRYVTESKSIDREGLGESRTGTKWDTTKSTGPRVIIVFPALLFQMTQNKMAATWQCSMFARQPLKGPGSKGTPHGPLALIWML